MSRGGLLVFMAVFATGLLTLLAFALLERRTEAFTLGVAPAMPLEVPAGKTICQRPIDVPATFDRAEVRRADGTVAEAVVRDLRTGRPLGSPVTEGRRIEVCIEGPATVLGNVAVATRSSRALLDGKSLPADMAVVFVRGESESLLELAPAIVERASLFHGSWVQPWVMAALGVLLLAGLPLLLGLALWQSVRD